MRSKENCRRPLIVGNWKMQGSLAANTDWFRRYLSEGQPGANVDAALCVPAVYIEQCQRWLSNTALAWGAQDLSPHAQGAYTGDVSAAMLADLGCRFVIVGHSERRIGHGESDADVASKAVAAMRAGLTPIVCLGETNAARIAGATAAVLERQLAAVMDAVAVEALPRIVIAYEPVWSIGTGKAATPHIAQQVHAQLRAAMAGRIGAAANTVRILYGGSMNAANAAALLDMPDVDGGLVGGASLKAQDFLAILNVSDKGRAS